jgi:hypothetical protein
MCFIFYVYIKKKNSIFIHLYILLMSRTKGINKEKVGFSLDKEVAQELQNFCEENSVNKSHLVNRLIKKYLEKSKKYIES